MDRSFAILIHGGAAFPGEGIVAETLNLCCLPGFHTGGTIHIIANNQIGFTTVHSDSRSSKYASDLAKGYEIPIVHVNADDQEACLNVIQMAFEYRRTFHKDFLIDLVVTAATAIMSQTIRVLRSRSCMPKLMNIQP